MERVTLPSDIVSMIRADGVSGATGTVSVLRRDDEGLLQILGATDPDTADHASQATSTGESTFTRSRLYRVSDFEPTGELSYVVRETEKDDQDHSDSDGQEVLYVPVDVEKEPWLADGESRTPVTVLRSDDAVFQRVADIVDTEYLSDTAATIVGVGTVGSTVAMELAKSGVGAIHLYDPDVVEIHNISRHVCDLPDVGRRKVAAVAEKIRRRNPTVTVHAHSVNVLDDREKLRDGITHSDVVLSCTDTTHSRAVVNEEAVAAEVPTVFAGAWERGYGGQVIRTHPAAGGPCYACIFGTPDPMEQVARNDDGTIDYSQARDANEADFAAEPGLSVDVGFIALLQTRFALGSLLAETDLPVSQLPADTLIWGNRGEDPFTQPFESHWRRQERDPDCAICGEEGLAEQLRASLASDDDASKPDMSDVEAGDPDELGVDLQFDGDSSGR